MSSRLRAGHGEWPSHALDCEHLWHGLRSQRKCDSRFFFACDFAARRNCILPSLARIPRFALPRRVGKPHM